MTKRITIINCILHILTEIKVGNEMYRFWQSNHFLSFGSEQGSNQHTSLVIKFLMIFVDILAAYSEW